MSELWVTGFRVKYRKYTHVGRRTLKDHFHIDDRCYRNTVKSWILPAGYTYNQNRIASKSSNRHVLLLRKVGGPLLDANPNGELVMACLLWQRLRKRTNRQLGPHLRSISVIQHRQKLSWFPVSLKKWNHHCYFHYHFVFKK